MKPVIRKLQAARRAVQLTVLALTLAIPAVARYTNYVSARELDKNLEKWEGTLQGEALGVLDGVFRVLPGAETERAGQVVRDRKRVLSYAQQVRGGPWSAQLGEVSMTDPLAGAESVAASKQMVWVLGVSLLIPVIATVLLGRVFCSWVCPMNLLLEFTDKLRRVLRFLELRPRDLRFSRGIKYALLGVGLALAAALSVPVLGYVYPPAILGREAHDLVFGIFDRAEQGRFGFWAGGLTWMSLIVAGIALFEMTVSRRWWCRYVCPGGAVYSLLGWARLVRVRRAASRCTDCGACVVVCPMGLAPMRDVMGMECDNCGLCISHCGDDALGYRLWRKPEIAAPPFEGASENRPARRSKLLVSLLLSVALATPAAAHHIMGIPHYAYDEQYPQTPVLTYRVEAGVYDVKMTGYPGNPRPGERCTLHVYIRRADTGVLFDGTVRMTVRQDRLIGADPVIYGPMEAHLEERVFKFYPEFGAEANYTVRIAFEGRDEPWTIDLPMVAGEPGSPWAVLGGTVGGLVLFLVVVRAIRIKRLRRMARAQSGRAAMPQDAVMGSH